MNNSEETLFHDLFMTMDEGAAFHEILYDKEGKAEDYRILNVNDAFVRILGIPRDLAEGGVASLVFGVKPPPFLENYVRVASSGQSEAFTRFFPADEEVFFHFRLFL